MAVARAALALPEDFSPVTPSPAAAGCALLPDLVDPVPLIIPEKDLGPASEILRDRFQVPRAKALGALKSAAGLSRLLKERGLTSAQIKSVVSAEPAQFFQSLRRECFSVRVGDVLPAETRADITAGRKVMADLGEATFITSQKSQSGKVLPITFHSGRPMIHVVKEGRGVWFYQSFSGTGGKEIGRWYPVGGLAATPGGGKEWIIKGDPKNDKAFGRKSLTELEDYLNRVLPKSDTEVEKWAVSLANGDQNIFFEDKAATHIVAPDKFDRAAILIDWKQTYLAPVWGARGE